METEVVICPLHTPSMEYDMYDMTGQGRLKQGIIGLKAAAQSPCGNPLAGFGKNDDQLSLTLQYSTIHTVFPQLYLHNDTPSDRTPLVQGRPIRQDKEKMWNARK
jgi:hypothetical protein